MALLQVIALLTAVIAADCSVPANTFEESKIIGGKTARIDDAPFMVQIINSRGGADGTFVTNCGGALVSKTHVLTAAHCVPPSNKVAADNLQVFFGATEFMAQGTEGDVAYGKAFRAHPKYRILSQRRGNDTMQYAVYDVAVIKLNKAVPTSKKTRPISITKAGVQAKEGAVINVAGWGYYNNTEQQTSFKLRVGQQTVKKRAECQKNFGNAFTPQEFCLSSSPSSAFCDGDSGGPAYIGNVQYGIVSWGNCGLDQFPDVLTNLADPEINSFVQKMIKTL